MVQLASEPAEPPALPARELYPLRTRLTAKQREELIRRYVDGERAYQLASEFGVHRQTVANVLMTAGARRPRLMTEAERAEAVVLYEAGWTCARIGEELGRSRDAVRRALRAAGLVLRRR
jgi:DNA-directed RNA polymerase specialized sigma24 family protein